ncbi:hypothetical protein LR48_Vigan10g119000 [Vigna angularis]|uniref:Uncharacterized protein n=1 Tax=Phaseolus angularis TaxID=3914 RepID=A0A0L9VJY1_PHAAN|nr:hypothetical protein LR48_Vigan10g119000 [Vigna angularis]
MGNRLCEPLGKLGFLGQWKLGLAGQHGNWVLQASMGNGLYELLWKLRFLAFVESGPCGSVWKLSFASQYGKWAFWAKMESEVSRPMWKLGLAGQHGNWALQAIIKAPRLPDQFPIPIIIDDDRDERQIPLPMPFAFRTRAPSTELSLRPPQPAREFFH